MGVLQKKFQAIGPMETLYSAGPALCIAAYCKTPIHKGSTNHYHAAAILPVWFYIRRTSDKDHIRNSN